MSHCHLRCECVSLDLGSPQTHYMFFGRFFEHSKPEVLQRQSASFINGGFLALMGVLPFVGGVSG